MNNLFQRYKWMGILLGVLLILAGVGVILLSIFAKDKVDMILSITVAVICFIIGLIYIIAGVMLPLSEFYSSLYLYGAFAISVGIILLIHMSLASEILIYTIAVILLTLAVVYIVRGVLYVSHKMKTIQFVLCFIIGGVCLVLGILTLIFKNQMMQVVYILAGVFFLLTGILQLISATSKGKKTA